MCLFNWKRLIWIFWYIKLHTALCTVVFFIFNTQTTGLACSGCLCWWVLCHTFFLTLFPMQLLWAERHLPKDMPFCVKNIPQSAKLLLHLSGSHLATHKLHYSFLLYLASSSCFFSSLDESLRLQMLKSFFSFSLNTQFHLFAFFGGQTCHSQLTSASGHLMVH